MKRGHLPGFADLQNPKVLESCDPILEGLPTGRPRNPLRCSECGGLVLQKGQLVKGVCVICRRRAREKESP